MQRQYIPSAVKKTQAVKASKAKSVSTPKWYPSAVRSTTVARKQHKQNVVLSLAVRLLAFTAKSVAKGLLGMVKFAFRLPGLFARQAKMHSTQPSRS